MMKYDVRNCILLSEYLIRWLYFLVRRKKWQQTLIYIRQRMLKTTSSIRQLTDVAKELMHYKAHFKDKIVFCNCDDPTWSAFWKYFHLNFSELGLKKLISTHYDREKATYKMDLKS